MALGLASQAQAKIARNKQSRNTHIIYGTRSICVSTVIIITAFFIANKIGEFTRGLTIIIILSHTQIII